MKKCIFVVEFEWRSGSGRSKLKASLLNVSLFQTSMYEIRQYFLLKRCEKLLHCLAKAAFILLNKMSVDLL